jgi:hypothetical protein
MRSSGLLLAIGSLLASVDVEGAPRFLVNGPLLTLTLKDPQQNRPDTLLGGKSQQKPWLDFSSLSPNALWEITSTRPPVPDWLPNLKQVAVKLGYQYHTLKRLPSWVEATAKFSTSACDLILQPSYELDKDTSALAIEATRGPHRFFARLANTQKTLIDTLQGSVLVNLPYASISSVRVTPTVYVSRKDMSCKLEAITGVSGRTKAILNIERNHPSLTVVHQIDARNTIAPTIDLYTAKMIYQWNVAVQAGSSLVTKVDPTR